MFFRHGEAKRLFYVATRVILTIPFCSPSFPRFLNTNRCHRRAGAADFSGRGIRLVCLVFFCGMNPGVHAEPARPATVVGVSINGGRVFIDGKEIPQGVECHESSITGEKYFIARHGRSVAVTSAGTNASDCKSGTRRIEAKAGNGSTVNAGHVVIVH